MAAMDSSRTSVRRKVFKCVHASMPCALGMVCKVTVKSSKAQRLPSASSEGRLCMNISRRRTRPARAWNCSSVMCSSTGWSDSGSYAQ